MKSISCFNRFFFTAFLVVFLIMCGCSSKKALYNSQIVNAVRISLGKRENFYLPLPPNHVERERMRKTLKLIDARINSGNVSLDLYLVRYVYHLNLLEYHAAIEDLSRLIYLDNLHTEIYNFLIADLYFQTGNIPKAIEYYNKAAGATTILNIDIKDTKRRNIYLAAKSRIIQLQDILKERVENPSRTLFPLSNNKKCFFWNYNPKQDDGATWSGECINGKISGPGDLRWNNGMIYRGNFENGDTKGVIEIIYNEKQLYKGMMTKGEINGKVHFSYPNGQTYQGIFLYSKPQGKGVILFPNGDVLTTTFDKGIPLHQGELICSCEKQGDYVVQRLYDGGWYMTSNCDSLCRKKNRNGVSYSRKKTTVFRY